MKTNRYTLIETISPTGRPRFILRGRRPPGVPGAKQINSTFTAKSCEDAFDVKARAEDRKRDLLLEDAQFRTNRRPLPTVLSAEQIEDAEFATRLLAQKGIDSKLSEMVELGIKQWKPSTVPAILRQCKLLWFAWRERRNMYDYGQSSSNRASLLHRLGEFFGHECDLNKVHPSDVGEFFRSPHFSDEKQYGQAAVLVSFFNFLIKRPDQTSDVRQPLMSFNPAAEVAQDMKEIYEEPPTTRIWSIEQVERNLAFAESHEGGACAAYMALTLFAGIRPDVLRGEITRIAKADYDPRTQSIELDKSKTKTPRQIDVSDNLAAWIDAYGLDDIIPLTADGNPWSNDRWTKFRKECDWSHDVTRHTCISFWLQTNQKREDRAKYMFGNADKIRNQHYRRKVTPDDAERFWNIVPAKMRGKVLKFA